MAAPIVRVPVWNYGLWRQPYLAQFLDRPVKVSLLPSRAQQESAWLCWGAKPSARRAAWYAAQSKAPLMRLEDGFLRSCGLGVDGHPPLSLVVDDLGIYYDATRPSRLEALLATANPDAEALAQARRAIGLIRRHRLSKYNHAPELDLPAPASGYRSRVLVIDQTMGDVSVRLGGADAGVFADMLKAALAENPDAEIWIKTHPDVVSGKKQGYLNAPRLVDTDPRIRLLAQDVSPLMLLEQVDKVYVVTSQMGFEALMLDKPVVCFGLPWYAGWGLSDDRNAGLAALRARRARPRTVEQLFEAAYLRYSRYLDPLTGASGTIFDVIDWLARNKALNDQTRGTVVCVGMSMWKRHRASFPDRAVDASPFRPLARGPGPAAVGAGQQGRGVGDQARSRPGSAGRPAQPAGVAHGRRFPALGGARFGPVPSRVAGAGPVRHVLRPRVGQRARAHAGDPAARCR